MVLGFGRGSIEVKLQKHEYKVGETVEGTLLLKLNEPTEAKELRVELIAEQRTGKNRQIQRVYTKKQKVKGSGTFRNMEVQFSIRIPSDVNLGDLPEGTLGKLAAVGRAIGVVSNPPQWYIQGVLDVSLSLDTTIKVQILIKK